MYCKNCGKELPDGAKFCRECGAAQSEAYTNRNASGFQAPPYVMPVYVKKEYNILAILGLVFSFLVCIAGLVLSILGYRKADEMGGEGKGLALAGIIVSAVSIGLVVLTLVIYLPVALYYMALAI